MQKPARIPTYQDYLRLEQLLDCQSPPDFMSTDPQATRPLIHHDELLFIITHQTMELWFKMVIADVEAARDLIGAPGRPGEAVPEENIPRACTHLERCAEILKHLNGAFGVIETMAPLHFLTFRDQLNPSSGFQSWQFRELEVVVGMPEQERIEFEGQPYFAKVDPERRRQIHQRMQEMTLRDALFAWLARTPYDQAFPGFVEAFVGAHDAYIEDQRRLQHMNPNLAPAQAAAIDKRFDDAKLESRRFFEGNDDVSNKAHAAFVFIATYANEPLLRWPYALIQNVLAFEEHFRLFRFRHARMVERMIGLRIGSGGSTGVEYLDRTTMEYRIFGDLLRATSYLIKRASLPDLPNPELLRFRFGR